MYTEKESASGQTKSRTCNNFQESDNLFPRSGEFRSLFAVYFRGDYHYWCWAWRLPSFTRNVMLNSRLEDINSCTITAATRAKVTAGKWRFNCLDLSQPIDFHSVRLMHGSSYIWGYLVPASILLFVGFYISAQLSGAVKLTAAIQIDQRARSKIIKRRGLQIGLFFKVRLSTQ